MTRVAVAVMMRPAVTPRLTHFRRPSERSTCRSVATLMDSATRPSGICRINEIWPGRSAISGRHLRAERCDAVTTAPCRADLTNPPTRELMGAA
jgi:hypothetical protein